MAIINNNVLIAGGVLVSWTEHMSSLKAIR